MRILVINTGSSSIKFELFDMDGPQSLATGIVERIGTPEGQLRSVTRAASRQPNEEILHEPAADHVQGLVQIVEVLKTNGLLEHPEDLDGIGHRVVHGGERFREPVILDDDVIAAIGQQVPLAPLHNPANLLGIDVTRRTCPSVPQVAVFDTAFHQTIPPHAHRYAIPSEHYTERGVRRYGFHGTSHFYVAKAAAEYLGSPLESLKLITFHLGNGASAAAIDGGRCVDTSMGFTPLEGLMMGTRSGDIDAAILPFLADECDMSLADLDTMLNKQSGLIGICGASDMREIITRADQQDAAARLAIAMFTYRIKKYLGAYLAVLGGADAVVFTAGIGENVPRIREQSCTGLERLGIVVDPQKNSEGTDGIRAFHAESSTVQLLVIPTDEELEIARQTAECISASR